MQATIRISHGVARMPKWRMAQPVDIELLSQEHLAIVGRNGAGKSTFARVLCGLERRAKGQVFLDGREWPRKKRAESDGRLKKGGDRNERNNTDGDHHRRSRTLFLL